MSCSSRGVPSICLLAMARATWRGFPRFCTTFATTTRAPANWDECCAGVVVLIRSVFADGKEGFPTLLQFFPGISQIFSDLPTIPATIAAFARHGFVLEARRRVEQQTCANLRELADRTRLRADASLALLSDNEFEACQAALDAAATRETGPTPVLEALQLLVFRSAPA